MLLEKGRQRRMPTTNVNIIELNQLFGTRIRGGDDERVDLARSQVEKALRSYMCVQGGLISRQRFVSRPGGDVLHWSAKFPSYGVGRRTESWQWSGNSTSTPLSGKCQQDLRLPLVITLTRKIQRPRERNYPTDIKHIYTPPHSSSHLQSQKASIPVREFLE